MHRNQKSQRSRREILDASLQLFSHHGYGATSIRDIADAAGVSIGNVYHHFADKETIFKTLLDELTEITGSPAFPYRRALSTTTFPDNMETLGFAARDSIREFRAYFALIYVDVIEFEGTHIRNFYGDLTRRFTELVSREGTSDELRRKLRPGVSPISALMLVTRVFFNYFTIEHLFNVPEPFGKESEQVIAEITDMLRKGMLA